MRDNNDAARLLNCIHARVGGARTLTQTVGLYYSSFLVLWSTEISRIIQKTVRENLLGKCLLIITPAETQYMGRKIFKRTPASLAYTFDLSVYNVLLLSLIHI